MYVCSSMFSVLRLNFIMLIGRFVVLYSLFVVYSSACGSCFHKSCFNPNTCPKCIRLLARYVHLCAVLKYETYS